MLTYLKKSIYSFLKLFDKRVVSYHAPAKPYLQGVEFLKNIIDGPGLVIDVGVADGTPDIWNTFSVSDHTYLLIEANPKFFPTLEKLVEKYPRNVNLEKSFCGERTETTTLSLNKEGHSSSKYSALGQTDVIEVSCKSLDDIVKEHGLTKLQPILLKIDVEGSELDVLKGATGTLSKCDVVIMETWINVPESNTPAKFAKLVAFMDKNSFVVFDFFAGCNHQNGVLAHVDTVFVKKNSKYRNIPGYTPYT